MNAYRICEACGAALDPGERCDCRGQDRVELIQPESNFCGQCGQPLDWGGEP